MDLNKLTSADTSATEEWIGFFNMVEEAQGNNTIFVATKSTVSSDVYSVLFHLILVR